MIYMISTRTFVIPFDVKVCFEQSIIFCVILLFRQLRSRSISLPCNAFCELSDMITETLKAIIIAEKVFLIMPSLNRIA